VKEAVFYAKLGVAQPGNGRCAITANRGHRHYQMQLCIGQHAIIHLNSRALDVVAAAGMIVPGGE
jgi:hypothetical protein